MNEQPSNDDNDPGDILRGFLGDTFTDEIAQSAAELFQNFDSETLIELTNDLCQFNVEPYLQHSQLYELKAVPLQNNNDIYQAIDNDKEYLLSISEQKPGCNDSNILEDNSSAKVQWSSSSPLKPPKRKLATSDNKENPSSVSKEVTNSSKEKARPVFYEQNVIKSSNHANNSMNFGFNDLKTLLQRIDVSIPMNDTSSYRMGLKKINWEDIAFKHYTPGQCENAWLSIQKHQRCYRTLREVLNDVELKYSKTTKPYPDFLMHLLNPFLLYYHEVKDDILKVVPSLKPEDLRKIIEQQYRRLSTSDKNKYITQAAEYKAVYKAKLKKYYEEHPEIQRPERKPTTPFELFYKIKSKTMRETNNNNIESVCRGSCLEDWFQLSEEDRVSWINAAIELDKKDEDKAFEQHIKNRKLILPRTSINLLSEYEMLLKTQFEAAPKRPYLTGYGLFFSELIEKVEFQGVSSKLWFGLCRTKWKELTDEERMCYNRRNLIMREEYRKSCSSTDKRKLDVKDNYKPKKICNTYQSDDGALDLSVATRQLDYSSDNDVPLNLSMKSADYLDSSSSFDSSEEDTDDSNENEALNKFFTPKSWDVMDEAARAMYLRSVLKMKSYFDTQHNKAFGVLGSLNKSFESSISNE